MKKLITFFALMVVLVSGVKAQNFLVGGGLVYGTDVERWAFDMRGDFRINQNWAIVPNINFFFPQTNNNYKSGANAINIDGHYIHALSNEAHIYPLFGLNFSTRYSKHTPTDTRDKRTELGVNLGGGFEYFFSSKVAGIFELKYVLGDFDQGVLGFGILYRLN